MNRCCRESWMIYRWPGFLAVVWFGFSTTSPPLPLPGETTCWRERRGGWEKIPLQSYNGEKAWSSINHSILSGVLVLKLWILVRHQSQNWASHYCIFLNRANCLTVYWFIISGSLNASDLLWFFLISFLFVTKHCSRHHKKPLETG